VNHELILPQHKFSEDFERFARTQEITEDFLDHTAELRHGSTIGPAGDFHHVAKIPNVVIDKWMREGFNIFHESAKDIVARLKHEDLGAFLTTRKVI